MAVIPLGEGVVDLPGIVSDLKTVGVDGYTMAGQVTTQVIAVVIAILWSGIGSAVLFAIVKVMMGLRVSEEDEYEGVDIVECGMEAYPEFTRK